MPKKNYNAAQETALAKLTAAHRDKIVLAAEIEQKVRAEMSRQLLIASMNESIAANEADRAGVTKTDILKGLGIGNWEKMKAILEMSKSQFLDVPILPPALTFTNQSFGLTMGPGTVTFHHFNGIEHELESAVMYMHDGSLLVDFTPLQEGVYAESWNTLTESERVVIINDWNRQAADALGGKPWVEPMPVDN